MKKMVNFVLIFCLNTTLAQEQNKNLEGAGQEIQNIAKDYNAVGLSVMIVKNDSIIFSQNFGLRDYEKKLPVTSNTLFGIGSNTKAFTSALIGILEKEGKLKISQKPSEYIPGLKFPTRAMDELITVEDLLNHKSGLGSLDGSFVFFPAENRMKLLEKLPNLKQNAFPKESWRYSNFGYIILGTVAEELSKQKWDTLVREKLLKPLQMKNTNTSIDELIQNSDFSYPYGIYKNKIEKLLFQVPENDKPGAGINSSANDMVNWVKMWLNYGKFEDAEILPKDYAKKAMSTKAIINGEPPVMPDQKSYLSGYGYGWNTKIFKGHFRVDHGGAVSGYSSNIVLFPAEKFGIIVLTNQQNSDLPYTIANMLSIRMLGLHNQQPYPYEKELYDIYKPENTAPANEDCRPQPNLEKYCGAYNNKGYGTINVVYENKNLYIKFPAFKFILEQQECDRFRSKLVSEIPQQMNPEFEFRFNFDKKGKATELIMDIQNGVSFEKIASATPCVNY